MSQFGVADRDFARGRVFFSESARIERRPLAILRVVFSTRSYCGLQNGVAHIENRWGSGNSTFEIPSKSSSQGSNPDPSPDISVSFPQITRFLFETRLAAHVKAKQLFVCIHQMKDGLPIQVESLENGWHAGRFLHHRDSWTGYVPSSRRQSNTPGLIDA